MITDLAIDEAKLFNLAGAKFYYVSGIAEIHLKLVAGGNTKVFKLLAGQGVDFKSGNFSSIEIKNGSVAQQIEFEVYENEVFDNRIPGSLSFRTIVPASADDIADAAIAGGASASIAEDATRKTLTIYCPVTNSGAIRVGPNAGVGRGYQIGPGGSYTFNGSYAVDIHNDSGAGQDYGWIGEFD